MDDQLIQDIADDIALGRPVRSMVGVVDDLAQAYEMQEKLGPSLGPICGRKIAMNSPALMVAAGVSEPIVGYITGSAARKSGATLRPSEFSEMALEPEFAAVVAEDIPIGTVVTAQNVVDHVARLSMAFEVLDKRNDPGILHAPTFVVNNVFSAGVVLSDQELDVDALNCGAYNATFDAAGQRVFEGTATAPQNPLEACAFVINHFSQRGDTVKAGEVILCGAHYPPKSYTAEGEYEFSLSSGESVSLSISL